MNIYTHTHTHNINKSKMFNHSHIHITVKQRDKAAAWLAGHTGIKLVKPTIRSENLIDKNQNLLQIQSKSPVFVSTTKPSDNAFIDSVGIAVNNLKETLREWENDGGTVLNKTPYTALVEDPWNVRYELIQSTNNTPIFKHINIFAKKHVLQSLLKWYHNKFGGEISTSQYDQSSPCLKYRTMELIFISNRLPSTNNRAIDHLGFRVESTDINLQEACEYLMTNDVQIEIPVGKFGNFAFFKDPMNIWYELFPDNTKRKVKGKL